MTPALHLVRRMAHPNDFGEFDPQIRWCPRIQNWHSARDAAGGLVYIPKPPKTTQTASRQNLKYCFLCSLANQQYLQSQIKLFSDPLCAECVNKAKLIFPFGYNSCICEEVLPVGRSCMYCFGNIVDDEWAEIAIDNINQNSKRVRRTGLTRAGTISDIKYLRPRAPNSSKQYLSPFYIFEDADIEQLLQLGSLIFIVLVEKTSTPTMRCQPTHLHISHRQPHPPCQQQQQSLLFKSLHYPMRVLMEVSVISVE